MRLKLLYTLSLLLCLSTFASSNERAGHCRPICTGTKADTGKATAEASKATAEASKKIFPVTPLATSLPILRLLSI